jgi:ABC-2 type transport system ATP-binding protein
LEISGLVKQYSSQLRAVDGIDLEVGEGEVFGLIGPNGAGKSTTIRIVATLLSPTAGTVKVLGHDVVKEQQEVRKIISYLPEEAGAYDNLSGEEYLRFMARFYGGDAEQALQRGIRIAELGDRIKSKTKEYSKGMKRRLLIG